MQPWMVVFVFCFVASVQGVASAALVGITGGNESRSVLFELDPRTGAVIRELGDTGLTLVTGMAFHPITGELYLHQNNRSSAGGTLWSFDLATLTKTEIGSTHINSPDITFDSAGNLFGWMKFHDGLDPQFNSRDIDKLVSVDATTGQTTPIGDFESTFHPNQVGLAFDRNDRLILKGKGESDRIALYEVSTTKGGVTHLVDLGPANNSISVLAFDESNQAFTVEYRSGEPGGLGEVWLQTIDTSTGAVANIGNLGALPISALAFTSLSLSGNATAVPEPGSAICLVSSCCLALAWRRRLRRNHGGTCRSESA